ncbi:hypothetical protein GQ53DRAFT_670644 [Thozetella sp. PMI_491]|nr:hypothetical protein GQ53DRAFT_670644 [Thozetella sp. PMI_491]
MANITLALSSRVPKRPIRKLPAQVEVPENGTVEDAKRAIARQAGIADYNRLGLYEASTQKILKDRKASLKSLASKELLVKDLGPQADWRTVYIIEYAGPIVIHALFPYIRQYIYFFWPYVYKNETATPMSTIQWLLLTLFVAHFVKRELETIFLHKFSANTMPFFNMLRNSGFYWAFSGLLSGWDIYAPGSLADRNELGPLDYFGIALYVFGELANFNVHLHLAQLRSRGGTEKGIPSCFGSSLVTCPNYMFEVIAWIGVILISRSWSVVVFISVGISFMASWSKDKEKALRTAFPDKYKRKRYTMLPGLI